MSGIVTNIQRFSIHDGPGIRTTVFLKGCNLRCFWCHNPETLSTQPQLQLFPNRCIGCGACFTRCVNGAHERVDGARAFHRELCKACGNCAETCYAEALVITGEDKSAEQVVAEVLRDKPFYETSHGGVTLSGGEPLLQFDFSYEILQRCKAEGLHTAIETALNFPWQRVEAILPVTDLVMLDIKLLDPAKHKECTGVSNERILENIRELGKCSRPLIVRTPIIPGMNDTPDEVLAIAHLAAQLPNLLYYELLPFHPMASGKYDSLGIDYRARDMERPSKEKMDTLVAYAQAAGIQVKHS
ncbi:MAG: glycyl-radical enzyme activating protein [Chloroflexi bacterium]|nr:glycyl-radical enzyme activating protein [Chloroflexota bacterium]